MKTLTALGKRLLPLVVLAAVGYGIWAVIQWQQARTEKRETWLAQVTAELWVGTARLRSDPAAYALFRDSLLRANHADSAEITRLLTDFSVTPEQSLSVLGKVSKLVDSISRVYEGRPTATEEAADSSGQ